MCSFIFADGDYDNRLSQRRGQDCTTITKVDGFILIHNLLSITGDVKQPYRDGDAYCLFNGEIYNHADFGDFKTDGECILPAWREYGDDLPYHLDGEFAILIYEKRKIYLYTDPFATKPLFINGNSFATYESSINGGKRFKTVYNWDLRQHKDSFDDWTQAFKESIRKRTCTNKPIFFGLSAGYDSGSIACELLNQDVPFETFTVLGVEDDKIIEWRIDKGVSNKSIYWDDHLDAKYKAYMEENVEIGRGFEGDRPYTVHGDKASRKLCWVCDQANGHKIYLSGQGADEIFSDYGFNGKGHFSHSNFGGLFPEDLSAIFPWASFYGSTMQAYLAKEECIAGSFNLETRYPFLDKKVVQEFLWLTPELNNKWYKSVLHNYLTENNFPFNEGVKTGF